MIGLIVVLLTDTAVLMVIVRVMEEDDFDWWRVGGCALLMSIVMGVVGSVLPGAWALLGYVAAAAVGALAISAVCGMAVKRAAIAAGIFLGYKIALSLLCLGMLVGMGESAKS